MGIRIYKPTTPGRRHASVDDFKAITASKPEKRLTVRLKKNSGRNNQGKITIRHKGGGHAQRYRLVDFKVIDRLDIPGKVKSIEYDPNRSAYIMLVTYADGQKRYHLAPDTVKVDDKIIASSKKTKLRAGNRMQLKHIPIGFNIHNIELAPGKGGQAVKCAGVSAKIVSLETKHAQVEMPSGEIRFIPKDCFATIGTVSNEEHFIIKLGKAGRSRWLGRRPVVRGSAMNPVDHPHGGGQGKCPIGMKYPKTPWGKHALGVKTRNRKRTDFWIIKRRAKKDA